MIKHIKVTADLKAKNSLKDAVWNLRFAADQLESYANDANCNPWIYEGDIIDALAHLQKHLKENGKTYTTPSKVESILRRCLGL